MLSHDPQNSLPADSVALDEPQTSPDLAMAFSDETGRCQIGLDESEKLVIGDRGLWTSFSIHSWLGTPGPSPVIGRAGLLPGIADTFDTIELAGWLSHFFILSETLKFAICCSDNIRGTHWGKIKVNL